jgi:hypothetical protein
MDLPWEIAYASEDPPLVEGVDILSTDSQEERQPAKALRREEIREWFSSGAGNAAMRLLTLHQTPAGVYAHHHKLPFTREVYEQAVWKPDSCLFLTRIGAGACSAFLDVPWRFVLHSSDVPGPFFSLNLSCQGTTVKGVYYYDNGAFEPSKLLQNENIQTSWRRAGVQIISLPQALARAHASYVSSRLNAMASIMHEVEDQLVDESRSFSRFVCLPTVNRSLQECMIEVLDIERRSRFHAQILEAVDAITSVYQKVVANGETWPALHALRSQSAPWEYELATLTRRIENARATITTIVQQRDSQLNLEIAESSRKMTEAALQDSASMKTIAMITMVSLPGTAVASFFSMSMFDWSSSDASGLASKWL